MNGMSGEATAVNGEGVVMATEMGVLAALVDVSKVYGQGDVEVMALSGLSLEVGVGEFLALMGPSGSGKSTALHVLGGLDSPSSGQALFRGEDWAGMSAGRCADLRQTRVGFVFQRLNLIPSLTIEENVMLPLELGRSRVRAARAAAREALSLVGISKEFSRFPDEVSGGEQQRVAIARAIVGERELLLADEPTGSLDTARADAIVELLVRIRDEVGTAIVLVTHEPRFASWADRVVVLRDGEIVSESVASAGQR